MNDIAPWQTHEPLPDRPCARVIEDSVSRAGHRLTTLEVKMHRFVLAEFNTHRLFSRNSASSRAIPYEKQRDRVLATPAFPLVWPEEQKGMQGGGPLADNLQALCWSIWQTALSSSTDFGDELFAAKLHKSLINRLLEPFAWHTVLVTATEWRGFWAQRVSPLAQPEIHACAIEMEAAYSASTPTLRHFDGNPSNGWHLPWIKKEERESIELADLTQLSSSRSCRVSYMTHNKERDLTADYGLYERLKNPGDGPPHASPLEHPAAVEPKNELVVQINPGRYGLGSNPKTMTVPMWGNFIGWCQLRHMVMGEKP